MRFASPQRFQATLFAAAVAVVSLATSLSAIGISFGPPPGAHLSLEKLAPIEDFVNGEIMLAIFRAPSS